MCFQEAIHLILSKAPACVADGIKRDIVKEAKDHQKHLFIHLYQDIPKLWAKFCEKGRHLWWKSLNNAIECRVCGKLGLLKHQKAISKTLKKWCGRLLSSEKLLLTDCLVLGQASNEG